MGAAESGLKLKAVGFEPGERNGIGAHHNCCGDPDLGLSRVACRHTPSCSCGGCQEKAKKHWVDGVEAEKQPRHCGDGEECEMCPVFQGLNKWKVVSIEAKKDNSDEALEGARTNLLVGIGKRLAEAVVVGGHGATAVEDDDDYPCCPLEWIDLPWQVTEDEEMEVEEGGETMLVRKGELMCKGKYLNAVLVSDS